MSQILFRSIVGFSLFGALLAGSASASSINTSLSTQITDLNLPVCKNTQNVPGAAASQSQCGFSVSNLSGTTTTFSGLAKSAGSLGYASSLTQLTVTNVQALSSNAGISLVAGVDETDFFTNNSNSPLDLTVTVTLTGTATPLTGPYYQPFLMGRAYLQANYCTLATVGQSGSCSVTTQIGPQQAGQLDLGLSTSVYYGGGRSTQPTNFGGNFSATLDYYTGFAVTGFSATDLNGNPVSLSSFPAPPASR